MDYSMDMKRKAVATVAPFFGKNEGTFSGSLFVQCVQDEEFAKKVVSLASFVYVMNNARIGGGASGSVFDKASIASYKDKIKSSLDMVSQSGRNLEDVINDAYESLVVPFSEQYGSSMNFDVYESNGNGVKDMSSFKSNSKENKMQDLFLVVNSQGLDETLLNVFRDTCNTEFGKNNRNIIEISELFNSSAKQQVPVANAGVPSVDINEELNNSRYMHTISYIGHVFGDFPFSLQDEADATDIDADEVQSRDADGNIVSHYLKENTKIKYADDVFSANGTKLNITHKRSKAVTELSASAGILGMFSMMKDEGKLPMVFNFNAKSPDFVRSMSYGLMELVEQLKNNNKKINDVVSGFRVNGEYISVNEFALQIVTLGNDINKNKNLSPEDKSDSAYVACSTILSNLYYTAEQKKMEAEAAKFNAGANALAGMTPQGTQEQQTAGAKSAQLSAQSSQQIDPQVLAALQQNQNS